MNFIQDMKIKIAAVKMDKKNIRVFALIIMALAAYLFYLHPGGFSGAVFVCGFIFLYFLAGFFYARALYPFYKIWMAAAVIMGFFVSKIILAVLYYFLITPLGLAGRLFGKDFLAARRGKSADSYWLIKEKTEFNKDDFEKLY